MTRPAFAHLGIGAALIFAVSASAHERNDDVSMRTLGLDVGNAYACLGDEEKQEMRDHTEHLFSHILEERGQVDAYDYAVSLGYGAARSVDTIDCGKALEYWNSIEMLLEGGE